MLAKLLTVTVIVMQSLAMLGRCLAVGALGLLLAAQCQNPAALTTGLTGTVTRGPITPVCRPDVPCDAPMRASFDVRRGGRTVASFQTDAQGHFTVKVAPGAYTIVPAGGAGMMGSQSRDVTVGPEGLTEVQLSFDTGIR